MKINVLFCCTSNADRSPALEEYFRANYPQHEYRSAGVNKYFTSKKGTHCLTQDDIDWCHIIVFAEDIHYLVTVKKEFKLDNKTSIALNLGEYVKGAIDKSYLQRAEKIIKKHLK